MVSWPKSGLVQKIKCSMIEIIKKGQNNKIISPKLIFILKRKLTDMYSKTKIIFTKIIHVTNLKYVPQSCILRDKMNCFISTYS